LSADLQRCVPTSGIRTDVAPYPLRVTSAERCPSQWRPESLLDVLRKRIDHSAFVITLVCPEEPAVNERVDLATVKFDRKTAKARPTSCPATTHSACGGFPYNNGFCRYVVY
jgi:hypothetical protein